MIRTCLVVAAAIALADLPAPAQPENPYADLRNFLRVNDQVCTGGQPTPAHLARLKEDGVRAIINLRQPTEHDAGAEREAATALGLRYVSIPFAAEAPTPEALDRFLEALADEANRPAFLHCGSANRVGAFWMVRRVLVDGWPVEKAEEEARRIGLRSPNLVEFARAEIGSRAGAPATPPAAP